MTREFITHVMMYSVNREILVFENAEDIIDAMKSGCKIHMVLSEVHLPGKSGLELLQYFKKNHDGIVFITVSADPGHETPATELGADAFLSKPFHLKDLFGIVQHFVVESPGTNSPQKQPLAPDLPRNEKAAPL
jgi:DNA-binding NtrC family response regulator